MFVRLIATCCWIGVIGLGVHLMLVADTYDQWAGEYSPDGSAMGELVEFGALTIGALGGTDTGRVLTIMGSFMIAGTWIPSIKRKRAETLIDNPRYARDEEKILRGELHDDPAYEFKV